jgi:chromosome segregation ATPase
MDEQAYQYWQSLHRRVMLGETLTTAEQAVYESGCEEMDAKERLDGNLERLRELRTQIAAAETEQQRLQAREAELDARIAALDARLDARTRQLLGINS